jgi:O-antigen/teichoic acid export membrane protein
MTVGTTATAVISALALIYVSRILGPTQFGIFSVGTSFMAIISRTGDMGLATIITRLLPRWKDEPAKAKEFLAQLNQWKMRMTGIGLLVGMALIPFSGQLFNFPYPTILLLALYGCVGLILYEYTLLVLSAFHFFQWVSALSILQAVMKVAAFLLLGVLGVITVQSVSFWYYTAPLLASLLIMFRYRQYFFVQPRTASTEIRQIIRKYIGHAAVGMVAMTLISNIDVLFVQKYLSSFDTGLYSGAMRISLFVAFLTSAIGGVMNNRVARYQTRELLSSYLRKSLVVVAAALIGFVLFLPFAGLILNLTIGPEFSSGLPTMIILVFNAFLSLAIVPYISFFYAVEHPNYFSIGGTLQVVIIAVISVLFLEKYGITAAAWSRVLATLAHAVFTTVYIWFAYRKMKVAQSDR